jgi:hypothetical protein
MAVASIGPVMTGRPIAFAANWLSRRFCVPPPTMFSASAFLPVSCLGHLQ